MSPVIKRQGRSPFQGRKGDKAPRRERENAKDVRTRARIKSAHARARLRIAYHARQGFALAVVHSLLFIIAPLSNISRACNLFPVGHKKSARFFYEKVNP